MRGTKALRFVLLGLVLCCGQHISYAQEQNESTTENHNPKADRQSDAAKPGAERQMHPYRAEFLITELEEGKKLNSRHYSMLLNAGGWTQIRIGTRVPSGPDAPGQFLDVGTNINCRLTESGSDVAIDVRSDFSNFFSTPNQEHAGKPIVRQINIEGNTVVTSGKPVIIGAVDDPNSNRQFQLEATVTRLK